MRNKVTIVGSGNVGATTAHWIAASGLADIVLVDVIDGVPQGKGLDLLEAMPIARKDVIIQGAQDYADTADSDVVVITAGVARKPGMSRDDLLNTNLKIMRDVVGEVVRHSPMSILVIVSNPLDAMAYAAYKAQRLPAGARDRYGRSARLGPLPGIYRAGIEGERCRCDGIRAGRARRFDGSSAPLFLCGRHSHYGVTRQRNH